MVKKLEEKQYNSVPSKEKTETTLLSERNKYYNHKQYKPNNS